MGYGTRPIISVPGKMPKSKKRRRSAPRLAGEMLTTSAVSPGLNSDNRCAWGTSASITCSTGLTEILLAHNGGQHMLLAIAPKTAPTLVSFLQYAQPNLHEDFRPLIAHKSLLVHLQYAQSAGGFLAMMLSEVALHEPPYGPLALGNRITMRVVGGGSLAVLPIY